MDAALYCADFWVYRNLRKIDFLGLGTACFLACFDWRRVGDGLVANPRENGTI